MKEAPVADDTPPAARRPRVGFVEARLRGPEAATPRRQRAAGPRGGVRVDAGRVVGGDWLLPKALPGAPSAARAVERRRRPLSGAFA